jgi:hypothetical protein
MRKSMIAILVAGQLAAAPAAAADLVEAESRQVGAFGGIRVSVPLDGARRERPVRAGLALAPTVQARSLADGPRSRIGEGLELGLTGDGRARLTLAGTRLDRLGAAQGEEEEDEGGLPTWAWIAGGVTVALGAGLLVFDHLMDQSSE